ncbi:MAG TPA: hypothetical protein VIQ02_10365 [Jiangellaceae bacterium]
MLSKVRPRRPSAALVLAFLALSVALSGTAVGESAVSAAQKLITGKQIKNRSVTSLDIKTNSLTSAAIQNGSLLGEDFKLGELLAGPAGPQGPKGDTGTVDTSNFYDRATSDARFLGATAKATDGDRLDGVDSTGFVQGPGSPSMWSYRRDWARNNALVHDLPNIPGLGQLSFTCQQPNTTGPGLLSFRNTSSTFIESFATTTTATGSTLSQLTTAPGATTTLNLGSGASQVVWQIGQLTYFNGGPLATVTASHVTDVTQCRVSALAHHQDPRRF